LHSLREKVTEIANDKTRDEKVKQLSSDQVKFRHEALFYDEEAALLRKKIKIFKETLNSVGTCVVMYFRNKCIIIDLNVFI
jgi:hypothetical protein